eukprot:IDg7893t1
MLPVAHQGRVVRYHPGSGTDICCDVSTGEFFRRVADKHRYFICWLSSGLPEFHVLEYPQFTPDLPLMIPLTPVRPTVNSNPVTPPAGTNAAINFVIDQTRNDVTSSGDSYADFLQLRKSRGDIF